MKSSVLRTQGSFERKLKRENSVTCCTPGATYAEHRKWLRRIHCDHTGSLKRNVWPRRSQSLLCLSQMRDNRRLAHCIAQVQEWKYFQVHTLSRDQLAQLQIMRKVWLLVNSATLILRIYSKLNPLGTQWHLTKSKRNIWPSLVNCCASDSTNTRAQLWICINLSKSLHCVDALGARFDWVAPTLTTHLLAQLGAFPWS